jgi:hypothetical protein
MSENEYDDTVPTAGLKLLTRMVAMQQQKVKTEISKKRGAIVRVQECEYCVGIRVAYRPSKHPRNKDCAGTGIATDWR